MTIIQTAIAVAIAVAGTAATTAIAIHAGQPVACQNPADAPLARKLDVPALPMTGNPTTELK